MKKYKRNQYVLGYSSIGAGVAGYMGAIFLSSSYKNNYSNGMAASLIGGLVGVLTTQVLSKIQKDKRLLMKSNIVKKYNNL